MMGRGVSQQEAAGVLAWLPAPGDNAPPATAEPPGDSGGAELEPPSGEVAAPPVPAPLLPTSNCNNISSYYTAVYLILLSAATDT